MTTALTVGTPSPQATAATAGRRTSARRGGEKPSIAGGFDAVLADHAALPKPIRQAKVKPSPEAQTRGADKSGASRSSHQSVTGSALKTPRANPAWREDAAKTVAAEPISPVAAEPVDPIAAPVIAPPVAGAPIAGGLAVSALPPTPVPLVNTATANDAPASLPGMTSPDAEAMVAAENVVAVTGHAGADGPGVTRPETLPVGQDVAAAVAPTSNQPRQGLVAAGAAGAPTEFGSGVAPEPVTRVAATSSATLAAPMLSPVTMSAVSQTQPIAAEVSASVAKAPIAPGLGVPPALVDTVPPAAGSTASAAQPEAAVSILAQDNPSADPGAPAATTADGAASGIPGPSDHSGLAAAKAVQASLDTGSLNAVSSDQASLGEPVVVSTASGSDQPQAGPDARGAAGAPTAPVQGVAPMLASPVPPAAMSTTSAAPAMGQPASFPLPAAHQQVLTAVSPLLRRPDGNYAIELQLHPKDLGAVQVTVDVRHGEISIQMHAPDAAAREALRNGLSDLRQQLESQGLRAGSMEVGSGGANARQPQASWSRPEGIDAPERSPVPPDPLVAPAVGASSTSLDLRM